MRAPLSVIIPTLNAGPGLALAIAALGEGLEAGLIRELIISDGGSEDETCAIAEEAGARLVRGVPGRGGQLARGAAEAKGDWLLFLHGDTLLSENWTSGVQEHIKLGSTGPAGYFQLAFQAAGFAPRFVAGWANLRSRLLSLPYGDQGLLISRALFDSVGGYQDIPLMEDVALARALRGKLRALPATAYTSAARYEKAGWIKRGSRNLWTLTRYFAGASPEALARSYRR